MKSILISACLLGVPCRYDGKSRPKIDEEALTLLKSIYNLIPVCPEIYGGLPTPRTASERVGDRVIMKDGTDVTENYRLGAEITLDFARLFDCSLALLKEKSPSCSPNLIYDGTFSGTLTEGRGVTAELLGACGVEVIGESKLSELIEKILDNHV